MGSKGGSAPCFEEKPRHCHGVYITPWALSCPHAWLTPEFPGTSVMQIAGNDIKLSSGSVWTFNK